MRELGEIFAIYKGSNGDATKALYAELEALGPAGVVAVNIFRAQKASERAKVYRGRGYRDQAYQKKQWSMENLARVLVTHAETLGLTWGWAIDPAQGLHNVLLYVDLPTGQISWHTERRAPGPDYAGEWDGVRGVAPQRICTWIWRVLQMRRAM